MSDWWGGSLRTTPCQGAHESLLSPCLLSFNPSNHFLPYGQSGLLKSDHVTTFNGFLFRIKTKILTLTHKVLWGLAPHLSPRTTTTLPRLPELKVKLTAFSFPQWNPPFHLESLQMCLYTLLAYLPLALPMVAKSLHLRGFCYLSGWKAHSCQLSYFLCIISLSSYLCLLHEGKDLVYFAPLCLPRACGWPVIHVC